MEPLLLWLITVALFLAGIAGIFVPALPGLVLVFAGVLFYAIFTDFSEIGSGTLIVFGGLALIGWLTDYLGAMAGARAGGGRAVTLLGLAVGAALGLFMGGPAGLVWGGILGALAGALAEGKTMPEAGRAAVFSFLGIVGARIFQLALAVGMIVAFLVIIL